MGSSVSLNALSSCSNTKNANVSASNAKKFGEYFKNVHDLRLAMKIHLVLDPDEPGLCKTVLQLLGDDEEERALRGSLLRLDYYTCFSPQTLGNSESYSSHSIYDWSIKLG